MRLAEPQVQRLWNVARAPRYCRREPIMSESGSSRIDAIPRTALGKVPLVHGLRPERDDASQWPRPADLSTLDVR